MNSLPQDAYNEKSLLKQFHLSAWNIPLENA